MPKTPPIMDSNSHDAFVSFAGPDRDEAARPLVHALREAGLSIWFDEDQLQIGDSLRRSIEAGLAQCRWGIVILSPSFFEREWPQNELNALFSRDLAEGSVLLPVWHKLDREFLLKVSPMLSDRWAARMQDGLDRVVEALLRVISPERYYRTVEGRSVSVFPKETRLHTGFSQCVSQVLITNPASVPVHSVWIKMALNAPNLAEMIELEMGERTTAIEMDTKDISVGTDVLRFNSVLPTGNDAVFLVLHTLRPHETREFLAKARAGPVRARISISGFQFSPESIYEQNGDPYFAFSPPETMKLKSTAIPLRRRT